MDTSPGPELVNYLDAFVDGLQAGRPVDKQPILIRFPEAAPLLEHLEELNALGNRAGPVKPVAANQEPSEISTIDTPGAFAGPTFSLLGPAPATQFGKYELLEVLGRGGMGVVYRARQTDLNRLVAVKMILASHLASPEQISRFEAESRAVASLHHPHVLRVYEAGLLYGQHYYAMEYVEGASLAGKLRQGPMPADRAAWCLGSIARAVGYLHERGIIHRDLKPANILIDGDDRPYVTDFGLVKMLAAETELTGTGAIVGTPSYMAPEQAAGRNAEVSPLSDVYSLGAILYEMLTGRPPFREATPFDTLVQVLEGEPVPPRKLDPRIPVGLETICQKAMAKAPEDRYKSADIMAEDLERYLRDEPILARSESRRQRLARWAKQEPGLVSHLFALAAVAAIAQVYFHFYHPVPLVIHCEIMGILGLWAVVSLVCQAMIRRDVNATLVRKVWLAADGILLTSALWIDEAWNSPLVLCYGLYVVASGLWFQAGLVWLTTLIAGVGYCLLLAAAAIQHDLGASPQHHAITLIALILLGYIVASQVNRVRALSRYYEHRPLI
jgi:serine/threonine-protein kinase